MTRPRIALIGILLIALASMAGVGLAWGAKNAIEKSDDLLRRSEEAALFVRGEDPYQDPDMTYPPSAPIILAPIVAPFGVETLKRVWLGLNLASLIVVGLAIRRIWGRSWPPWLVIAVFLVIAAGKPTRLGIGMGQFALIPLALMLVAVIALDRRPILSGILIGLALAKPTMALPLLGFVIARGKWKSIASASIVQVGSILGASAWLGISPITLLKEWLALAKGQQAAGLIDVPTIAQRLIPGSAPLAGPISIGILAASVVLMIAYRRRSDRALVGVSLLVAAIFTYHRPYDLVLLFPALASLVAIAVENRRRWAFLGSVVLSGALIWPSKPGVGPLGEANYEVAFIAISYLSLGLVLWGLIRGLPGQPPNSANGLEAPLL